MARAPAVVIALASLFALAPACDGAAEGEPGGPCIQGLYCGSGYLCVEDVCGGPDGTARDPNWPVPVEVPDDTGGDDTGDTGGDEADAAADAAADAGADAADAAGDPDDAGDVMPGDATADVGPDADDDAAGDPCADCAGQCLPDGSCAELTVISADEGGAVAPIVDEGYLYWAADGSLRRFEVGGGGEAETFTPELATPVAIAAEESALYLVDSGAPDGGALVRVAKDDGAGSTTPAVIDGPLDVATASGDVFWSDLAGVHRVNGIGMNRLDLTADPAPAIAVAAAQVWYLSPDPAAVKKVSDAGGDPEVVVAAGDGVQAPRDLAVDVTHVVWISGPSAPGAGDAAIMAAALDGSDPAPLAADLDEPWRLAIDDTHAYWIDRGAGADGSVWRVARGGGDPEPLAIDQALPSGLALDGASVYWTNEGDGSVVGRAK